MARGSNVFMGVDPFSVSTSYPFRAQKLLNFYCKIFEFSPKDINGANRCFAGYDSPQFFCWEGEGGAGG